MKIAARAHAGPLPAAVPCVLALGLLLSCATSPGSGLRVVVLGFDGMDYRVTRELMARGRLPNLARLAQSGGMSPLQTTIPPQSPVAWSTFITGLDPGGHGIFDFVHRDPGTMAPYLSTTRTDAPRATIRVGRWRIPLLGGRVRQLRGGHPFWGTAEEHGVPTSIIRMPANFPPSGTATRELSGMGTPDLIGSYGTFSFYTSAAVGNEDLAGGQVHRAQFVDNVARGVLYGPDNPLLAAPQKVTSAFSVYLDPEHPVAKIAAGNEERVLREGEWSDWVPVEFRLAPMRRLRGMCRFYLKQARPVFELYVSPINLDPWAPALPISSPASYARELAEGTGRFYTQGMPEETSALSAGVLSRDEFLVQSGLVLDETMRQFHYVLDRFDAGLLFYYFGTLDQVSHMMWRPRDREHPAYDPVADPRYETVVEDLYIELDHIVGDTLAKLDSRAVLIVMSDHGFTSWRRSFHLNSWLERNGYLALADPSRRDDSLFASVDWSRTRAYGLGLNGLYLNLAGRERNGIVPPGDREQLMTEIADKLLQTVDPATGRAAVAKAYRREQAYRSVHRADIAPDMIVAYAQGTRGSNESALGAVPADVIVNNLGAWSGDHCMDPNAVPGVLISSRPLRRPVSTLQALGGAILAEFDIQNQPASQ